MMMMIVFLHPGFDLKMAPTMYYLDMMMPSAHGDWCGPQIKLPLKKVYNNINDK